MATSGSSYPGKDWTGAQSSLVNLGGFTGKPTDLSAISTAPEDPSARTAAVQGMIPYWDVINLCVGGTKAIRAFSERIIPREPEEPDDAYQRRIFHAVLPPFLERLANQAAGTILRKGIHLEGGDETFWSEWIKDVTGDGTSLNVFARSALVDSILYGHTCVLVDYPADDPPRTLREQVLRTDRKPYLVPVTAQQIVGWRTRENRQQSELQQVRYLEKVVEPDGRFGESIVEQVRVLEAGHWEVWRRTETSDWSLHASGDYSLSDVPLVTIYSERITTLVSRPPLLEVAYLNLAYCQRFTDYHHAIHVGAQPILVLKGFDEDGGRPLGLSVNTAVLLPPDGDALYVEPTADAYEAQLKCLQTLEEQISSLGINTLTKQNITNAAAEAKRLDRVDSDSIMAIISEDLARAIQKVIDLAAEYAGVEAPTVTIPTDYENKLLDGNQITAYLQLYMQGAIDQETLLRILKEGEVLPAYIDIEEVMTKAQDFLDEQLAREVEKADALAEVQANHAPDPTAAPGSTSTSKGAKQGGVASGKAAQGSSTGNQTLPTPLRPGKHKSK